MRRGISNRFFILFIVTGFLLAPMAVAAEVNLPDFIESMDMKGDLRVRYDYQDLDAA